MAHWGARLPPIRELIRLGPAVAERMALGAKPTEEIASCYVLTRAANAAWERLNRHLSDDAGAIFWIGGSAGTGKTHFLNYVLALNERAGALSSEETRRISLGLDVERSLKAAELEARLLEALARALGGNQRAATLWREMGGGGDALNVALSQAHRSGVRAVMLAIDFGETDPLGGGFEYIETLAGVAAGMKHLKFTVLAAGRVAAPKAAIALDIACASHDEELAVAVGRARQLRDQTQLVLGSFYKSVEPAALTPEEIFPFHPISLAQLASLANPPGTVAAVAALARDILAGGVDGGVLADRRLVMPCDLVENPVAVKRIDARLSEAGRAALKSARSALARLSREDAELGWQMIATLVLEHLCGTWPVLDFAGLADRLPERPSGSTTPVRVLQQIAEHSKGTIRVAGLTARFDPLANGTAAVAAFNVALTLAKLFDPSLTPAQEQAEVEAKLKRLGEAMAGALEAAHQAGEALAIASGNEAGKVLPEYSSVLADYAALAGAGPEALLEVAASSELRVAAMRVIGAYEAVARAAAAAPRLRAMSEYLEATGLLATETAERNGDAELLKLETDCRLLAAELGAWVLLSNPHMVEAIEARVNRLKWAYAERYRGAHQRYKAEIVRLARTAQEATRHLDALARLDSIPALGPPLGIALAAAMADLNARIKPCAFNGRLSAEVTPRCECGFVLGALSPERELDDAFEQIKLALRGKLAALSRNAIARVIKKHDRGRRLEGFLKIAQAAQTEALVRVLDDKLTRYLSDLLDETGPSAPGKIVKLKAARKARRGSKARR